MYILDVRTPNKLLNHKGKQVRTPARFTVTEKEIKMFKVKFHQVGIDDYTIRSKAEVDKELAQDESIEYTEVKEEVIIEEIEDDPEETRSVLDQLIKDAEKEK